jgi:hypothetical protein
VFPPADGVNVDYVRRARVLDNGMAVYVIPALNTRQTLRKRPERCFARERLALEHRLRGKPAQAQRAARRLLHSFQHGLRVAARRSPQAGLSLFVERKNGGFGGGGGDVETIRNGGALVATGVRGHRALVVEVVPDGVATVDFEFARGHSRDPDARRFYPHVYRARGAAVHNVVALTAPRSPLDVLFHREVWRAADGSIVKIVRTPTAG